MKHTTCEKAIAIEQDRKQSAVLDPHETEGVAGRRQWLKLDNPSRATAIHPPAEDSAPHDVYDRTYDLWPRRPIKRGILLEILEEKHAAKEDPEPQNQDDPSISRENHGIPEENAPPNFLGQPNRADQQILVAIARRVKEKKLKGCRLLAALPPWLVK
jgi:hypothetical protein